MSDLKMGEFIGSPGPVRRDAVHCAVAPVRTTEVELKPGQWVKFKPGYDDYVVAADGKDEAVGIVDPFLPRNATRNDRFLLYMTPGTTHSLRHNWTHPQMTDDDEVIEIDYSDECRGCN